MQRLQDGLGIQDPVDLVEKGFYEADRWKSEIQGIAERRRRRGSRT